MLLHRGWRTRGHLPHADFAGLTQAITFRLADALPAEVLDRLHRYVQEQHPGTASERQEALLREQVNAWLDAGHGSCLLRDVQLREVVITELRRHDGVRYQLLAFVVMPNHVHVLARLAGVPLGRIVQAWKGASGREINRIRQSSGTVWQREYYDRFIRDDEHLIAALRYIAQNPGRAGLGERWDGLWMRKDLQELIAPAAD